MKKLQIIAFSLLITLCACASSKNSSKNWFKGTWKGIGCQIDGQKWETLIDAKDLTNIKVNYPSLSCSGNWKIISQAPKQLILQEIILAGVDKCDQNVKIIIDKTDNSNLIKVAYFLPNGSEKIASADLRKNQ